MKPKNKRKRLEARMKEYAATTSGSKWQEAKVAMRVASGGYHRPGSLKK